MKGHIFFYSLLFLFALKAQANEEKNIIVNGDFEATAAGTGIVRNSDPKGGALLDTWSLVVKEVSAGTGAIVSDEKHGGENALHVNLTNIDFRYRFFLVQELADVVPAEYTFKVWLKADKEGIPFRLDVFNFAGGASGVESEFKKEEFKTTLNWKEYEVKADMSALTANDIKLIRLIIRFNCQQGGGVDKTNVPINYLVDDISFVGKVPDIVPVFKPEPYLQTKTAESILVNWLSATSETGTPTVEYGLSESTLTQSATGAIKTISTKRWCEVKLSGLLPDTEYFYRSRIDDNVSDIHRFRTLPSEQTTGKKIRFITFGDTHEGNTTKNVADAALEYIQTTYGNDIHNHIDFIAHTGDVVAGYGEVANEFEDIHIVPRRSLTYSLPILIAAGNHDFEKNDSQRSFFYDFMNFEDLSDAEGTAKGKYFSQRIQNSLFIYTNTNKQYLGLESETNATYRQQAEAQLAWVENKLNEAGNDQSIDHVFVFGHHNPYSEAAVEWEEKKVGERLFSLLKNSSKVRMYQCGHIHAYERSVVEKADGQGSFVMNINGNSGSYPDYFGREKIENLPQTHRSMEYTGFTITEIDPADGSFTTQYLAYGQRRVVQGESSTRFLRMYDPLKVVDSWTYRAKGQSLPDKPALTVSKANNILTVEGSEAGQLMSVQYRVFEKSSAQMVQDTLVHWEDYFSTTGYVDDGNGSMDLNSSYLHVNLNENVEITRREFVVDEEKSYECQIRYRNQHFMWSEWSDRIGHVSSGIGNEAISSQLRVYPTKTRGPVTVSGVEPQSVSYQVYSVEGRRVAGGSIDLPGSIDLSTQANGMYILSLTTQQTGSVYTFNVMKND